MLSKRFFPSKSLWLCLILGLFTAQVFSQGIDYQWLKSINRIQNPADNGFQKIITNSAPYITVGLPIAMFGVGFLDKDRTLCEKSFQIGVAVAITVGETYALKKIINRPRPYVTHPDIKHLATGESASMPSGHTSGAFALATALSLNYPKWYVAVPAFAWAGATGFSRLYMGVHYPSDVLVGAVLGSGTAWLTWKANKWLVRKRQ